MIYYFKPFTINSIQNKTQSKKNLYVSQILHKAVIKVNHKGTEAAAVTAVVFDCLSAGPKTGPPVVYFDKPFDYYVVHNDSNTVIFSGKFEG